MDTDHSLDLRKGIVERLRRTPKLVDIVGGLEFICAEEPPPKLRWPFVRYGFPIVTPFHADGWRGNTHRVTIHTFSKGPGTDQVYVLNRAVLESLTDFEVVLPQGLGVMLLQWAATQVLRDSDEASAYHGVIEFDAATAEVVETLGA